MKYIINILLIVFIGSCNAKRNNQSEKVLSGVCDTVKDNIDTTVGVISLPESTEKEYFLIIHNDTSDFSLFVNSNSKGNTVATYRLGSQKNNSYAVLADSSAVVEDINKVKKKYKPVYFQNIRELQLTLISAAEEFELKKLEALRISMSDISGFSENITKQYNKQYGEKIKSNSNYEVADLIKKSEYVTDLNNILSIHKIVIDKVFLDGLVYYKRSNSTLNSLDGMVIFTMKLME